MFQGFSQETVDFMWGIRFNNERSWFMAHKEEYQKYFNEPMKELGAEVQARLLEKFPDSGLNVKVSRIYRDARRLFGRGPYKDHLWLSIFRWDGGEEGARPVLWFELTPDGWHYGLGMYCAQAVTAAKLRARMDADPAPMEKLTALLNAQSEFVLEGPEYAKAKKPASPILAPWYNKKYYSLIHTEPNSAVLYDRGLVERIFEGWKFLMPFYEYLSTVPGDPDPRVS